MNGNSENNKSIRFGIAPINWNNDDLPALGSNFSIEKILSEMSLAGYEGTELGNKFPNEASVLSELLNTLLISEIIFINENGSSGPILSIISFNFCVCASVFEENQVKYWTNSSRWKSYFSFFID